MVLSLGGYSPKFLYTSHHLQLISENLEFLTLLLFLLMLPSLRLAISITTTLFCPLLTTTISVVHVAAVLPPHAYLPVSGSPLDLSMVILQHL